MPLRDIASEIEELFQRAVDFFAQSTEARWLVVAVLWLFLSYRLFGQGAGKKRGFSHLYDIMVVVVGTLLVWSFNFR